MSVLSHREQLRYFKRKLRDGDEKAAGWRDETESLGTRLTRDRVMEGS